ncbi:leucine-rich repeat domain-containing protein [Okeania sp. SIO2C9]|nr:leucine-rich repeat domain-containing protein [Okeania sp. SIO2C9]
MLESISKITNLTELSLSENQFKTIPESITKLTNLTQLYLSYNKLKTIP